MKTKLPQDIESRMRILKTLKSLMKLRKQQAKAILREEMEKRRQRDQHGQGEGA